MLRLIIYGFLLYGIYQVIKKFSSSRKEDSGSPGKEGVSPGEDLVEDPCCHTYIPVSSACQDLIDGRPVYFCSQKCREEYRSRKD